MNKIDDITTPPVRESDLWTITEPGIPLFMSVTLTKPGVFVAVEPEL